MKKKEFEELKNMTLEELEGKVLDLREKLFNLRIEKERGQLKDTSSIKNIRRDIARVLTILNEKRRPSGEKK